MTVREVTEAQRRALQAQASAVVLLAFVQIEHPSLTEDLFLVADAMDYQRDGHLWQGVLFRVDLPSDTDGPPEASITVPNTDRRIGQVLRTMTDRAFVTLEVCSSADFDVTVDPRVPLGVVTPLYPPIRFELVDVQCSLSELTGRLMVRDFAQEPFPSIFATQSKVPGLFR